MILLTFGGILSNCRQNRARACYGSLSDKCATFDKDKCKRLHLHAHRTAYVTVGSGLGFKSDMYVCVSVGTKLVHAMRPHGG